MAPLKQVPNSTGHSRTQSQLTPLYSLLPLHPTISLSSPCWIHTTLLLTMVGGTAIFLVCIPCGDAILHLPILPTSLFPCFSGTIFGKYPLFIYLFILTFSLGPDEAATVWCMQKPVYELLALLYFS